MTTSASLRMMTAHVHGRSDRIGLWIALALGALLMLAAALAGAEEPGVTVKRTDHFNATLASGATLRIENISGDVVASAGKDFSATVTISVTAPTKERAEEILRATTIEQKREDQDFTLKSHWHWESGYWKRKSGDRSRNHGSGEGHCEDCKIIAQYQVTVPPGVHTVLRTVN